MSNAAMIKSYFIVVNLYFLVGFYEGDFVETVLL